MSTRVQKNQDEYMVAAPPNRFSLTTYILGTTIEQHREPALAAYPPVTFSACSTHPPPMAL